MQLTNLRLSSFQSFGPTPTDIAIDKFTFLIGPNGSGKTSTLQALCRLFAFDPKLRAIQKSDFHIPASETCQLEEKSLWIEATFNIAATDNEEDINAVGIPAFFDLMKYSETSEQLQIKFRLEASIDFEGEIKETLYCVHRYSNDGTPVQSPLSKSDRLRIQVHYLPARRDPASHIMYGANTILGRLLRSINWLDENEHIQKISEDLSNKLLQNGGMAAITDSVASSWSKLHKGQYFSKPLPTLEMTDLDSILNHISMAFTPGHEENCVNFSRLSDGQKSLLYLSLIIAYESLGQKVLEQKESNYNIEKLRPAIFTIIAMEEPENSLSPHYLGRIISIMKELTAQHTSQAIIATHSPSILKRIDPCQLRYLRLTEQRESSVNHIILPEKTDEACKYVQEAVKAYPEIYFSRLVILGEGDSELLVLPRLLQAKGLPVDESGITVAPLGGRHVNHFWKLLNQLQIPYVTLLDFDLSRYQAGWGRIKYAHDQINKNSTEDQFKDFHVPKWNVPEHPVRNFPNYLSNLEDKGVFFSFPLDLDFSMLMNFSSHYDVDVVDIAPPSPDIIKSVLGDSHFNSDQYTEEEKRMFSSYKKLFKLGSKPASHLYALSQLSDQEILDSIPEEFNKMITYVEQRLEELPE
ncbi:AAA family ATPase [Halodesulfovibrio aestuarii]|uniref:ATP-dependent nuclease n=1 Tax=Halodesulfovibrio aestuarii TaxID=126333 RepID=UPI0004804AB3